MNSTPHRPSKICQYETPTPVMYVINPGEGTGGMNIFLHVRHASNGRLVMRSPLPAGLKMIDLIAQTLGKYIDRRTGTGTGTDTGLGTSKGRRSLGCVLRLVLHVLSFDGVSILGLHRDSAYTTRCGPLPISNKTKKQNSYPWLGNITVARQTSFFFFFSFP